VYGFNNFSTQKRLGRRTHAQTYTGRGSHGVGVEQVILLCLELRDSFFFFSTSSHVTALVIPWRIMYCRG
jgi:hypothetical protein